MYEFVAVQVLGISGLINLSNIVYLVAFSVRDVLKLRILAIVGEGLTLPYYYSRTKSCGRRLFGGGIHDRQRDPHRGDSFGEAAGCPSRRAGYPTATQLPTAPFRLPARPAPT
jgi:hypothetical protein